MSKVMLAKFCFWFHPGSRAMTFPACPDCEKNKPFPEIPAKDITMAATAAGCYFDEHGVGVRDCPGSCNQMVIFPGKVVDGVDSKEIIARIKPKGRKSAEWHEIHEWQEKGRKGKSKGKKIEIDTEEVEVNGSYGCTEVVEVGSAV